MPYTVTQLITDAYYLTGIVAREFQTVQGSQIQDGLILLNEVLSDKVVEQDMIPYWTTGYQWTSNIGQEKYFIPNLIQAETMVFYIDTVRYNMAEIPMDQYYGSARANNIDSLPFTWHQSRTLGGTNIFLYFFPNVSYQMELTGFFRLASVTINQDLLLSSTSANLGTITVSGAGFLAPGQLLVNGHDLTGTYATPTALVSYINTSGICAPVTATIQGTQFILSSPQGNNIVVSTAGTESSTNNVTFSGFSTTNGPQSSTFLPQGLDQFYISYLKYRTADKICTNFNFTLPPGAAKELLRYEEMITKRSAPVDMRLNFTSTLGNEQEMTNYGQANLGRGFTTAS